MKSLNCVLIGFGEIGKGVYEYYSQFHKIDIIDPQHPSERVLDNYDLMLITIPFSDDFISIISNYQQELKTKAKIIFSTLPIGTTSKLRDAIHTPIEGKHPHLSESIANWQVFMGGWNQLVYDFYINAGKYPHILEKSEHTEAMKLLSTTMYGINIEFARYCNEIFKDIGMEYEKFNIYNLNYNELYSNMGMSNFSRYLLNPPEGKKGGHCVRENSLILQKQYPNVMVDIVSEVNQSYD